MPTGEHSNKLHGMTSSDGAHSVMAASSEFGGQGPKGPITQPHLEPDPSRRREPPPGPGPHRGSHRARMTRSQFDWERTCALGYRGPPDRGGTHSPQQLVESRPMLGQHLAEAAPASKAGRTEARWRDSGGPDDDLAGGKSRPGSLVAVSVSARHAHGTKSRAHLRPETFRLRRGATSRRASGDGLAREAISRRDGAFGHTHHLYEPAIAAWSTGSSTGPYPRAMGGVVGLLALKW